MIKVYEPIKDQAKAATTQATAATTQAETGKQSAKDAHEDIISSQRAWIGPMILPPKNVPQG